MSKKYEIKEDINADTGTKIIVDTETGIQYKLERHGNTGGITLLTDNSGAPIYDDRYLKKENK